MTKLFSEDFLSKCAPGGAYPCSCGRRHGVRAKRIVVEEGALGLVPDLVSESFGSGCRVWVLSDRNTEEAAGLALKKNLSGFRVVETVLPRVPRPEPTLEKVHELSRLVRETAPDLLVAVGGGTISDLVKKISLDTGVVNWSVPTCPSVDAYTSGTAAIWERGYHNSVPSSGSEAVVCDLAVLEKAPAELFLSGLGDLLGKYLAFLDWHVSHMVTGETICETLVAVSLDSAKRVFSDGIGIGGAASLRLLVDALLTSGLVMQSVGSSRPAGSAEHTIAHFWEIAKMIRSGTYDLHGILAGFSGTLVYAAYREFYRRLSGFAPDIPRRLERFEREPSWEKSLDDSMRPYEFKMIEEMKGKGRLDRDGLEARLKRFADSREAILGLGRKVLDDLESAIEVLERAGFPGSPSVLSIRREDALLPFRWVRFLRNRYSSFDLMYETGLEEDVLEALRSEVFRET